MTTALSNASRFKNATLQSTSLLVSANEKVCVNCSFYRPFFTPPRSNIAGWCDTLKGHCNECNCSKTHLEYCERFEKLRAM